jgi:hypothetical protein
MPTFTQKQLRFTFVLSNNAQFAGSGSNTLVITGAKATVIVKGSGLPAFPEADVTIYGMLESDMQALVALQFQPLSLQRNTLIVEANDGQGFTTIFSGQIITGGPDYSNMPNVDLHITARVLGFESLNPTPATSYRGTTSVVNIVQSLAARMGVSPTDYAVENNGVTAQLSSPYFSGCIADQLRAVAAQSGTDVYIESNVIAICPKGTPRNRPTWVLSPTSGLKGYPKLDYNRGFVNVEAYFNPAFRFGGPITVQGSSTLTANGDWVIGTITNKLETVTINGNWFSYMLLYPPNSLPPIS